jgi:hypothetical protein
MRLDRLPFLFQVGGWEWEEDESGVTGRWGLEFRGRKWGRGEAEYY